MASSLVFGKFVLAEFGGVGVRQDLSTATIKVMLVKQAFANLSVAAKQAFETYIDINATYECSGTGYTLGGKTLTGVTSTQAAGVYTFDAADPTWTALTLASAAYGAVVYVYTGGAPVGSLLAYLDFGGSFAPVAADFTIPFAASGIFTVAS